MMVFANYLTYNLCIIMKRTDYKKMRNKRLYFITLLIIVALVFIGCKPNNYSKKYNYILKEELDNPRYGETSINYGYGNVDSDEMPELFIIRGTSHVDTVTIYTYDTVNKKAVCLGDFGGLGVIDYVPYQNKIIASYGNQGYYYTTVSSITRDKTIELTDCILRNNGNKTESFYGFDMDGFNGSIQWEEYDINQFTEPDATYMISEDEADAIMEGIFKDAVRVDISNVCTSVYSK